MEIIHLILVKANAPGMNGIDNVVHELATQQQQAGLAVEAGGFSVNLAHDYPKRTYTTQLFKASRNPFQVEPLWTQAILARKGKIIVQIHGGVVPRFYASARILQQHQIPYLTSVSISFIRLYGMLTNSRMGSSHHQTSFQFPERISINWNSLSAKLSNRARQRLFVALA